MFSRSKIKVLSIRLGVLSVTTVISIFVVELFLGVFLPQDLSGTWRTRDINGLFINKSNHSAQHQFGDRVVRYTFDSNGLRNLGYNKISEKKVLCLGDSFTFGSLLDDEDTFIACLQKKINQTYKESNISLLNGGHGGWGTSDYVRYFEEYNELLNVSGLIIFINTDDIGRSIKWPKYSLKNGLGLKPLLDNKSQKNSSLKNFANAIPGYNWLLENSHFLQLARNAMNPDRRKWKDYKTEKKQNTIDRFLPHSNIKSKDGYPVVFGFEHFKRLKKICDDRRCKLLVLTTGFHKRSDGLDNEPTMEFMLFAEKKFKDLKIEFYDCSKDFASIINNDYSLVRIIGDGHPNEKGAELIAEINWPVIKKFLEDLNF